MDHASLPGQLILRLNWSNLAPLLQALHNALDRSGWLRAILLIGKNVELCNKLEKVWCELALETGFKHHAHCLSPAVGQSSSGHTEAAFSKTLISENSTSKNNSPLLQSWAETEASDHPELSQPSAFRPQFQPGEQVNVDAGLLVLSSDLNVWIVWQDDLAAFAPEPQWQVCLTFDHQAIADLLRTPAIAAAIPHCSALSAIDLTNHPKVLRPFWLQLLHLSQTESSRSGEIQPLPTHAPFAHPTPHPLPQNQPRPQLLEHVWHQMPVGVLCESLEGGILNANPAFCQLTGYSEAQLRRLDRRAISHPQDFATELKVVQQVIQAGRTQDSLRKRFLCRDGRFIWAEVSMSLVGQADAEDSYILTFVTDLSDRERAEQEIQQRRQREALLSEISAKIRSTLAVTDILQIAVQRLKQALNADRVVAYQIKPDQSGICVAEAVDPLHLSMAGQTFPSECIPPPYLEAYRLGRLWSVSDVYGEDLADCHRQMLQQLQVRSMVAVAIQRSDEVLEPHKRTLWGLLVVHHCRAPRDWTLDEQQLVQAVANQVAIAIEQASFIQQLQAYAQELQNRVSQRTRSLERSLRFEQLIRHLTETLRKVLDEDQVLKAVVEGLVQTLGVDGCYASLFNPEQQMLEVRYEHLMDTSKNYLVGQQFPLLNLPDDCYHKLQIGQTYICDIQIDQSDLQQALLMFTGLVAPKSDLAIATPTAISHLVSPILDDQGLMGTLSIFQSQSRDFEPDEINLVEQVANQCAIAIRQARLYRQEHQQRLSAEYLRRFLDKSIDIFVEYDSELRYTSINLAGSTLLGYSPAEVLGKTNRELLGSAAEPVERLIRQAFTSNEPVFVDHEVVLPSGAVHLFETIYTPIADPTGSVRRVIGVCRDITEFRQQWQLLEQQNHQLAETSRLKEEFIATTSHELRTPLTAILGFSNVLLQEFFGELNSKQKDYIDRIHSSGQHLLELINDILDLSRLEADRLELEPQLVFIADICESVVSLIQERADSQSLTLEVEVEPDIEYIVADPRRLKQMLLNLLINAVKFTPAGAIGLKVYRSHSSTHNMDMIHFLVWDTGIGIADADQSLLFAPFSQIDSSLARKHPGTGLGLVITRKLAELHGGTVTLESGPNQGTQFTISLPLYQSPQLFLNYRTWQEKDKIKISTSATPLTEREY